MNQICLHHIKLLLIFIYVYVRMCAACASNIYITNIYLLMNAVDFCNSMGICNSKK